MANDYEAIRRREYELITDLLEVLPRIDGLSDEQIGQVRDALFHADHPYMVVFTGPFSAGKSSLINALLGALDLLPVGPVPTTDHISILRYGDEQGHMRGSDVDTLFYPSPLLKKVSFVDTPGLESIFQTHEETTRKFLHRSDAVILVMLATQAMTQRNLDYLRMLNDYGKKVIVAINQADLLTPEEAESVRAYVLDQSQSELGFKPDVWLVSARKGIEARADGEINQELWAASGLNQIERYVDEQLSDVARLRQKLQTPLQITQNTTSAAINALRTNQSALDHYHSIGDNVQQQLAAQKRDQDRSVREVNDAIGERFGAAAMRGSEAIRDIFRFSRALGSVSRGLVELVGLGRLARRSQGGSYIGAAFEQHKAFEPINELPEVQGKLGPRLEGKDVQDIDDLVKYARREIDALPPTLQSKVIGTVQAPLQYDRVALQAIRPELETIENEARVIETGKLERSLANSLLFLAFWEVLMVVAIIALLNFWGNVGTQLPNLPVILLIVLLALALLGFAIMPLRGRALEAAYTAHMLQLQARYLEALRRAADKQIEYSMTLRRDSLAPLMRVIEAQSQIHTEQLARLQAAQQQMTRIEGDLAAMGKRKLLGMSSVKV